MINLEIGSTYTFHDLEDNFGIDRSYSFQRNGAVTALILNGDMNPSFLSKAPDRGEILVAKGQMRENVAKKLNTNSPYPTFVKVKTNQWIYVGQYSYHDYQTDPETIATCSKNVKRRLDEIAGVIFLKRVVEKQAVVTKKKAA